MACEPRSRRGSKVFMVKGLIDSALEIRGTGSSDVKVSSRSVDGGCVGSTETETASTVRQSEGGAGDWD
eukprot:1155653-Rhodomonas_salina.2